MKRIAAIIVIGTLIFLTGCTTPSAVMKSWVGHHESELLAKWGAPDSVMQLEDGKKIYTWKRVWSDQNGVHQGRQTFTIDTDGKITHWAHENMPWFQRKF